MIFLYKGLREENKYGPRIYIEKKCIFPGKILNNYYLTWSWGETRLAVCWNPLKRIKKGEIYEYNSKKYNFKIKKFL